MAFFMLSDGSAAAQREQVAITSHGRISGYFVSAHEYAELLACA